MIKTKYPYGSVNIEQICSILIKGERYYFIDRCGRWQIEQETYECLKERGIPCERESATIKSL